ncbi:MAG: hypothetical protein U0136_19205 [Bdellovibrionota bacterium]
MGHVGLVLLGIAAVSVLIFGYAIVRLLSIHERVELSVRAKFDDIQGRVASFEHRLNLLQEHALDYINSLSGDGARALYELQQLLAAQNHLLEQIAEKIALQDINALRNAEKILDAMNQKAQLTSERAELENSQVQKVYDPNDPSSLRPGWESRAEELLQLLGLDISLASESSRASGIPRRRKRRGTSMSLKEAGILAALRGPDNQKS